MPRRIRLRKVVEPPRFKGYRPFGVNAKKRDSVEFLYEEYEAIKLADYDFMNHKEAADIMGVSRPTFARIYESARRKIAMALVETKDIKTVFGNAVMDKDWFVCNKCHARFNIPKNMDSEVCPACNSLKIESLNK
ncbi:DUF134 domain-containing protein [Marinifilum sp. N1E240]|uniref:DUF134 domain-containing protein n=1 Tax=Marinifilum sp. N1E240 TaxID=2608082 RepID=UPI00128DE664|nr:DUF134 domain-containing protein [Marinifilum sp. N1E240]MPQ46833.1 DUF134 domain-containing protein [Marinifilum sp. N1E240]|eukprot:TRINITY_DN18480_c0_g5_i1.p1 TRINITY_DN18480_c0_g5~~TRINITY_DN18480_c0_g5_i1.p1  ORF type:complete len:135 (+),score=27.42 TRINITY_DN18480_c0_g5_i1:51-455(+)